MSGSLGEAGRSGSVGTAAAPRRAAVSLQRVVSGLAFAVIGLGSLVDPSAFTVVVLVIALGSLREFTQLTARIGQELVLPVAAVAVFLYIALARFGMLHRFETDLVAGTIVVSLGVSLWGSRRGYFARSAYTLLGVLYLGKLFSYFVTLRNVPGEGAWLAGLAIVLIAATDTSCMLVGTTLGRTPLTSISPRKTVEGSVGGFLIVVAIGTAAALVSPLGILWWQGAIVGAVTSLAAQAGDLVESALKRDARVKDAGTALFGHGGWLDRFDSYTFGGVAFYGILHLLGMIRGTGSP